MQYQVSRLENVDKRMINNRKTTAILLAAGHGRRMRSKENKVYMDLAGRPVICYSLQAFQNSEIDEIIMVVSEDAIDYVRTEIVEKYGFSKVTAVIAGGKERYDSVYRGLRASGEDEKYVIIHDGARAFITKDQINSCIIAVDKYKACVMGMPVKDTIRIVDEDHYGISTPDRSTLWIVQTPQCFVLSEIRHAFDLMMKAEDKDITDDVMVLERYGNRRVKMIEGGYDNIKITTPEDLPMGEAILKGRK